MIALLTAYSAPTKQLWTRPDAVPNASFGGCTLLKPMATISAGATSLRLRLPACGEIGGFDGLALQLCVGRSLAALMTRGEQHAATPAPGRPSSGLSSAQAAICITRSLVHDRVIDDCHMVADISPHYASRLLLLCTPFFS